MTILYPVFVQVLLVLLVAVLMSRARRRSTSSLSREDLKAIAIGDFDWPEDARKRAANYTNQFELPVLFYAVVAFALIVRSADLVMIVLAWVFVLSRVLHAWIHVGGNRVKYRAPAFALGFFVLLVMWVRLAVHVIAA
ncbi:MAG: MAPEG family protein [Hyphomicrobiaceae bacterium]|nr:MAPEG family protein [Hyphomicrobiaceae bacterium]